MPAILKHNCKSSLLNIYIQWNSAISIHGFWNCKMCHFIRVLFDQEKVFHYNKGHVRGSPVMRQPEKLHFRHWRGSETSPAVKKTVHKHLYPWQHQTLAWQGGISVSTCLITMVISERWLPFVALEAINLSREISFDHWGSGGCNCKVLQMFYTSIHFGSCLGEKSRKKS